MKRSRRLLWLLGCGLLLMTAAAAYIEFHFHLPQGSGPAGPAVDSKPFAEIWSERPVLLVGLGDSVTAGFGARPGYSYFDRLATCPADEVASLRGCSLSAVLPNLTTTNLAVSGSTSLQHRESLDERLEMQPAETFGLIVMTTGGNDLIHWYGRSVPREGAMFGATWEQAQPWIANFEQRLNEMFLAIQEKFPGGCLIFVADIYDPSDGRGDPESTWAMPAWADCSRIHAAYNATLRAVAARHAHVRVVAMHDEFLGHGIHCRKFWTPHYRRADPTYWYHTNIEDPNERGYDALRRIFLNEIIQAREQFADR